MSDGAGFTLPQNMLKSMIRQTIYAVAQTDSRPVHTGIQFELENNVLKLVAVDGSRLAIRSEKIKTDEKLKFVVPGKTMGEVLKLLSDEETPLSLPSAKAYSDGDKRLRGDFEAF